jgi:predicted polyphosphate/ATP-dependent NAD kinase
MTPKQRQFRLGLVVNPLAGVGGPAAQKGSDHENIQARARRGELPLTAPARARFFLQQLVVPEDCALTLVTVPGSMGADLLQDLPLRLEIADYRPAARTTALDTQESARALMAQRLDLLIFVGGDGTARDVCRMVPATQPVLGVPAGVKMHSGVYAINPAMAAELVSQLLAGGLVNLGLREVRDIDEDAFRQGQVKSRFFGEMLVPEEGRFVQQVKQGGLEVEDLVLLDIAEHLCREITPDTLVIVGPGSTTQELLKNWGLEGTLLGVDLLLGGRLLVHDADATTLEHYLHEHSGPTLLVITAIGGQGHVIGRGNQQLTPALLRQVGRDRLRLVATKTKLKTLAGRPLLMDSGDTALDKDWSGYIPVITGFEDVVLYPLGCFATN